MLNETSMWVLDITDVYYNIALVGKERVCSNLKNDIMVSDLSSCLHGNDSFSYCTDHVLYI